MVVMGNKNKRCPGSICAGNHGMFKIVSVEHIDEDGKRKKIRVFRNIERNVPV